MDALDGRRDRGAIVLATKPQDAFITKDRLQPTGHDEPVPIGAPRANVAAGPLGRAALQPTLHDLCAAVVLRPTEGAEGTMFALPHDFEACLAQGSDCIQMIDARNLPHVNRRS